MTKIVINSCYGGFGLSEAAMRLYAEKKGLPFFEHNPYKSDMFKQYFTADPSGRYKIDEYGLSQIDNDFYRKYSLYDKDFDRTDPVLVEVVEELGEKANGFAAELEVIDIPKGTLYRIDEYDGLESIETADEINWKVA
jgi:hypothetical protein